MNARPRSRSAQFDAGHRCDPMTRNPFGGALGRPVGTSRHFRRSSRLLRRNRDSQPFSTLGSPAFQDVPPAWCCHASQEAVGSLTARVTWLKSSLHWSVGLSITPSRRCQFVTPMQLRHPRLPRPSAFRARRTWTRLPEAFDNPRQCRSCNAPSEVSLHAIACSAASSNLCRLRLPNTLRAYTYPWT